MNGSHASHFAAAAPLAAPAADPRPVVLVASATPDELRELLSLYDLRTVVATTGDETFEGAVIDRPLLVFIDSRLDGINAFETVRLIRAIRSLDKIPILFLSDYPERTERARAFEAGCDDYLAKPVHLDRIDEILEKHLKPKE